MTSDTFEDVSNFNFYTKNLKLQAICKARLIIYKKQMHYIYYKNSNVHSIFKNLSINKRLAKVSK